MNHRRFADRGEQTVAAEGGKQSDKQHRFANCQGHEHTNPTRRYPLGAPGQPYQHVGIPIPATSVVPSRSLPAVVDGVTPSVSIPCHFSLVTTKIATLAAVLPTNVSGGVEKWLTGFTALQRPNLEDQVGA